MTLRIETAPVPEDVAEPGAVLLDAVDVQRRCAEHVWGNRDLAGSAAEFAAGLRNQKHARKQLLVAYDGEAPLGQLWLAAPLDDNPDLANFTLEVAPEGLGHGVGTALYERAEATAREWGRRVLMAWSEHGELPADEDPDALAPPTGSGRLRRTDRAVRFARRHGFDLEQVERHSLLTVPADLSAVVAHEESARARAGDYALVHWREVVPQEWIEQYCVLLTEMSTDAPSAGLELDAEAWTPQRVRDGEAATASAGRLSLTTAVVHRPTGTLAGYTEIEPSTTDAAVAFQETTIVLAGHRGHRLGMLLKAANLRLLARDFPAVRRVHTWNAQENGPMLDINVALGFVPAGGSGAWQKRL